MGIKDLAFRAVDGYFKLLETRGYGSTARVMKVVELCIIDELFSLSYRTHLSNRTVLNALQSALTCLIGSDCLIPYPGRNNTGEWSHYWPGGLHHPKRRKMNVGIRAVDAHQLELEAALKPWSKRVVKLRKERKKKRHEHV